MSDQKDGKRRTRRRLSEPVATLLSHRAWRSIWGAPLGRQLFVVLVLFSLSPLLFAISWGYMRSRAYRTEAALRSVKNLASLEASQLTLFVRGKLDLMESIIGGNEHLFNLLRQAAGDRQQPEARQARGQLHAHLAAKVMGHPALEGIVALSATGRVEAASTHADMMTDARAVRACFARGKAGAQLAGFDARQGRLTLLLAAPVRDLRKTFLGVLCGRVGFRAHRRMVDTRRRQVSAGARVLVFDEAGRPVAAIGTKRHPEPPHQGPVRRALEQRRPWSGRFDSEADDGEEVIAALSPLPHLNWTVLVEIPVHEALASLDQLRGRALLLSGLLAALLIATVMLVIRGVALPLANLSQAATRMSQGALGERVQPQGPRDLVELARAFNRMSSALRDSHRTLEDRVAKRTAELGRSQRFTELLLDAIDHCVLVIDHGGKVVKHNAAAAALFGDVLEIGTVLPGVTDPEGEPQRHTLRTGEMGRAEISVDTRGGREILAVASFAVAAGGDARMAVLIARVVTGEKQLQAQMLHQEKMAAFGLLAAGVAHEIGNPLASIHSQLQLVAQNPEPDKVADTIGLISKDVQRIGRLLREMVDFTRRRRDEVAFVSPNQVIRDVIRLLSHDRRGRNVRFETALGEDAPIRAKEDHLVQVLLNLGINALDAMPEGGRLTFRTTPPAAGEIVVYVEDTGTGIPEDARQRLFEPFFTTKRPGRGTGLGLFVSKGVVEGMGGRLELDHTGEDGTTIKVVLPAAEVEVSR